MCSTSDAEVVHFSNREQHSKGLLSFQFQLGVHKFHAAGHSWVCFCLIQRCINPGHQVSKETKFCMVAPNCLWFLSVELALCHPSGMWDFVVAPRFYEHFCTPGFSLYQSNITITLHIKRLSLLTELKSIYPTLLLLKQDVVMNERHFYQLPNLTACPKNHINVIFRS